LTSWIFAASRCDAISAASVRQVAGDRGRARRLGALPADQGVDLVVALEQLCADPSAEEATGARDEEPHAVSLCRDGAAASGLVALPRSRVSSAIPSL